MRQLARRYRLLVGLQLPPGTKGKYLDEGHEADETELTGLNADALVTAGFLEEMPRDIKCPACAETGTAAQKKKVYADHAELSAHYASEHIALAAPAETEV